MSAFVITRIALLFVVLSLCAATAPAGAQTAPDESSASPPHIAAPAAAAPDHTSHASVVLGSEVTYRIGANDVLSISVLHAPELSTSVRVSSRGDISLPLLGGVPAAGLTAAELETELEKRLRERYIRDPDVTVQVTELQSQAVSVVGAVNRPGIFQVRGSTTLLEVLSLAGGLAEDAGDSVIVLRRARTRASNSGHPASDGAHAGESASFEVPLRTLLDSADGAANAVIVPGDVVNVRSAAIVYVVGAVRKPGAFAMRGNEQLTVLRALALGEGLLPSASRDALVLRTEDDGKRIELPVDLGDVLKGKQNDFALQQQDVLFVPTSGGKAVARAALDALTRIVTLRGVITP
ncbi:MAG TPA: polysaccharide biosynthesis/export family protein [Vicinamibacterales bacterium]|nr:polysaccharide biosynthesis/export family protein [Vicinamibacterales bacterium]